MSNSESLTTFLEQAARLDPSGFAEFCDEPVFVIAPYQDLTEVGGQTILRPPGPDRGGGRRVARVRKREGANASALMITIGRAEVNDIEIRAPGVSRYHAYLRLIAGKGVDLSDGGSTYGTFVSGRRLTPRTDHVLLQSHDEVVLGQEVRMTYLREADLYPFLRGLLRERGATAL